MNHSGQVVLSEDCKHERKISALAASGVSSSSTGNEVPTDTMDQL